MPVIFARLLLILFAAAGAWALVRTWQKHGPGAEGSIHRRQGGTTFHPGRQQTAAQDKGLAGTPFVMSRHQLEGLRDALTSATIDTRQALACCGACRSVYHQSSVEALRQSALAACVSCGSQDLSPVVIDD